MTLSRFPALLLLALLAGCEPASDVSVNEAQTPTVAEPASSPPESQADADTPAATDQVELAVASWDEIQTEIGAHQGKVVVVDLWSTSCLPCVVELPNLAVLQRKHPERVVCISVSLDYTGAQDETAESHREDVMKLLKPRKMTCRNFISSTSDFGVYDEIDLASIPAVFVYDTAGELVKRFDNDKNDYGEEGFTYADHIVPIVEQALGE